MQLTFDELERAAYINNDVLALRAIESTKIQVLETELADASNENDDFRRGSRKLQDELDTEQYLSGALEDALNLVATYLPPGAKSAIIAFLASVGPDRPNALDLLESGFDEAFNVTD